MVREKKKTLTVKNIRNVNMENILRSLLHQRETTRNSLAKENSISLMTVKHIVDELLSSGVLIEKESNTSEMGRNPKILELSEQNGNIVCMNLTSQEEITYIIYDVYENILEKVCVPLMEDKRTYSEVLLETMEDICEKAKKYLSEIVAVAVFAPSVYNAEKDLMNYDLIPDFKELHIKKICVEMLGVNNVLVLHDVMAAAKSEYDTLDSEKGSQFYFYCGHGVGGFYIHNNEPITGAGNMAGEVGKMLVSLDSDSDIILEECVSITAIKSKMKESGMNIRFQELLEKYEHGDKDASEILDPVFSILSKALYNFLWLYNPARIVVDSSKPDFSRLIVRHFKVYMERMKRNNILIESEIRQAKYDEYAMMRGCFHMARDAWIKEIVDIVNSSK